MRLFRFSGLASSVQAQNKAVLPLTVFFSIGIFMTYIGGLLGDKYGPIKIIRLSLLVWLPAMFLLTEVPTFSPLIMMPVAYLLLLMIGAAKAISYSPVIVLGQTYLAKSIGFASGITLGVSQTIGGVIAPVVGNLADTYSLPVAMMTLVAIPRNGPWGIIDT